MDDSGLPVTMTSIFGIRLSAKRYSLAAVSAVKISVLLAVLGAVVLGFSSGAEAYRLKESWQRIVEVEEDATLVIENRNGHVRVSTWDESRIEITAKIRIKATSKYVARRMFDAIVFEILEESHRVEVRALLPRVYQGAFPGVGAGDFNAITIRYDVKVPRRANLDCDVVNGDIEVKGLAGSFALRTSSGSITLETVRGSGKAHTGNGEMRCIVKDFPDDGALALSAVNGGIYLKLPGDVGAEFDIKTRNGRVRVGGELRDVIDRSRSSASGVAGSGTGTIRVRATNGDISIKTF